MRKGNRVIDYNSEKGTIIDGRGKHFIMVRLDLDWGWIWLRIIAPILCIGFSLLLFYSVYLIFFKKD